jgi:UDP-glucuronate 4-epimerase
VAHALVTGAAGFVGSHLAEALLRRGAAVRAVDGLTPTYDPARKRANLEGVTAAGAGRCEAVVLDLRDPGTDVDALLDGVEVVYHLAAQPGVRQSWDAGFADYVAHNVLVTHRLLDAARRHRLARFVYASSSSVYGRAARYPTTEDDLPAPHSPYGVTKLAAEHLCTLYGANFGVPTVSLRYFTVFGPRQRPDMAVHRLCEAALGRAVFERYGDGSQRRELTYVDDVVRATLAAGSAELAPGTVCNVAGGGEITVAELVALVEEVAGAPVAQVARPPQPGDQARNRGDTGRARALLGWAPEISLRDGIARQLAWHRAHPATSP